MLAKIFKFKSKKEILQEELDKLEKELEEAKLELSLVKRDSSFLTGIVDIDKDKVLRLFAYNTKVKLIEEKVSNLKNEI